MKEQRKIHILDWNDFRVSRTDKSNLVLEKKVFNNKTNNYKYTFYGYYSNLNTLVKNIKYYIEPENPNIQELNTLLDSYQFEIDIILSNTVSRLSNEILKLKETIDNKSTQTHFKVP